MPPRKSTASMTPADEGDSLQTSPQQTTDKPITATEQQIKARAEAGVSVDVSDLFDPPHSFNFEWKRQKKKPSS